MKFNYAAHAGPEAACVNPLHACKISNAHPNPPYYQPYRRPRARNGQTVFFQRERTRCLSLRGRAPQLNENITVTF